MSNTLEENMSIIKAANKVLRDGYELLPDDKAKAEYKTQTGVLIQEAISNAIGMVGEDEEFASLLAAWSVQEANQVITTLWRLQLLTEELEAEYRKLPTMQEMADDYNAYIDKTKKAKDEMMEMNKKLLARDRELDLFKGVINGMTKAEAEQKYAEYQEEQRKAMGR